MVVELVVQIKFLVQLDLQVVVEVVLSKEVGAEVELVV
jgi:hypothetical protein